MENVTIKRLTDYNGTKFIMITPDEGYVLENIIDGYQCSGYCGIPDDISKFRAIKDTYQEDEELIMIDSTKKYLETILKSLQLYRSTCNVLGNADERGNSETIISDICFQFGLDASDYGVVYDNNGNVIS